MSKSHVLYTFEEWLEKCKEIHGDKYDYTETDFSKKDELGRVKIYCKILDDDGKPYGYFWQLPYDHMIGKGYAKCTSHKTHTTQWFRNEVKRIYGDLYDTSKTIYVNKRQKVIVTCHKLDEFGEEYGDIEIFPSMLLKGITFPDSPKRKYTTNYVKKKLNQLYNDKFDYQLIEYKGFRNDLTLKCNNCGKLIQVRLKNLLNGTFKCPHCEKKQETILEEKVKNNLTEQNIQFEQFKTFDWLKNEEKLSLDFYLPQYNIAIECQGRFHFEPYKKGYETDLQKQQKRDTIKKELCKKHNIKILYFTEEKFMKYQEKYIADLICSQQELIKKIKIENTKTDYGR